MPGKQGVFNASSKNAITVVFFLGNTICCGKENDGKTRHFEALSKKNAIMFVLFRKPDVVWNVKKCQENKGLGGGVLKRSWEGL